MAYINFAEGHFADGQAHAFPCRDRKALGTDPRLDALSRASIAAWRGNGVLPSSEAAAFVAAGFRSDQLDELVASVHAARPHSGARA
ncbi:MAG TPA: hypothetical protein VGB62_07825 [Allosphingosinicella sp.]